jgi:hypothetical protein
MEKRLLQIAVAVGSIVPLGAGAAGMLLGPRMVEHGLSGADLDSHFRYLSGLLFAIGAAYVTTIPRIETHEGRFRLLTCIVVVGGMGRLAGVLLMGPPSPVMRAALVMELLVTPALAYWQWRVTRKSRYHQRV